MAKTSKKKSNPCVECGALCCRYLTVKINPPRHRADRDEHRWFLMHEGIEIRIEARQWYMIVYTPCRNLTEENLCRIYDERPDLCRDYEADACDLHGEDADTVVFRNVQQYDRYLEKRGMPWKPKKEQPKA